MTIANHSEYEAWNGESGRRWAADPDRHDRVMDHITDRSPIVDRAEALFAGDPDKLLAAAAALDTAGCRYQYARTLVFAGGEPLAQGEAILAKSEPSPCRSERRMAPVRQRPGPYVLLAHNGDTLVVEFGDALKAGQKHVGYVPLLPL